MVSQENPSIPTPGNLHQFLISDPVQNQFENQHYSGYGSDVRGSNTYPESLGVFPTVQSLGERICRSINLVQDHGNPEESEMGHRRHAMDLLGAPNEANRLLLSLGSQGLVPPLQYRQTGLNPDLISPTHLVSCQETCNPEGRQIPAAYSFPGCALLSINSSCPNPYPTEPFPNFVGNAKHLKAAQSLLEEVIDIGGGDIDTTQAKKLFLGGRGSRDISIQLRTELSSNGFLSAEKNEHQIKISKLINLLEQVESRYEEYCHRMEQLVLSFEAIAGKGAAKAYTALALQAMSRHFCSLRDAIISQIKVVRKKLPPEFGAGLSQLSLFDREARHNGRSSLKQLGVIQPHRPAWRPIRGLPETSVTILRAWLFEHFLHPYPNDSEKLVLASQTGITKNQVSNWFINARVRLWKPMIEEMYKEEFGESSMESDSLFSSTSSTMGISISDHHPEE
ncbi:hypothetical protein Nepgr_015747 [Nepenthes gracilis]|uniref:Homeobox domain-containing protein n=1 Tax=Nepenthes gracilis TaxID=150966 RepID=A0AAD3XRK7_NEPGR|nr:hypothetical protein Nepgr_015747 [Nepenthes gracilis]